MTTQTDMREIARDSSDFQQLLDEITSRELDARNIDTYADEALEDLIALVQKAVATYPPKGDVSGIESEQYALESAGLNPSTVELTLDHIAEVADSTKRLDALIMKKTQLVDRVLVPPDPSRKTEITPGDGSFEKPKELIPKLKTLLLLLEKGLDIDIEDDEEVRITAGALRPNMMRGASYNLVEIPALGRIVLVCDEVGNTTYVFDAEACDAYGIDARYLDEQGKPELDDLITEDAGLGKGIDYSGKYADELSEALLQPLDVAEGTPIVPVSILKPKEVIDYIPEGYKTAAEMMEYFDISERGLSARIKKIDPTDFGEFLSYRAATKGGRAQRIFSPHQQTLLEGLAGDVHHMSEGDITFGDMARELNISKAGLRGWIASIDPREFGATRRYRTSGVSNAEGILSPYQQELLRRRNSRDKVYEVPEGYATLREVCKELSITYRTLQSRIAAIDSGLFKNFLWYHEIGSMGGHRKLLSSEQRGFLRQQDEEIRRARGREAVIRARQANED